MLIDNFANFKKCSTHLNDRSLIKNQKGILYKNTKY